MPIQLTLWLAIFFALIFLGLRWRPFFAPRPYIKSAMAVFLGLYCLVVPQSVLFVMALGFFLSAIGDFFLDLPDDKFFLPGLIAFFLAHLAYAVFLMSYIIPLDSWTWLEWSIVSGLPVISVGFYLWLRSDLPNDMKVPVAAYVSIITIMGIAAFASSLGSMLIPLGAALFIASDAVLAIERFKFSFAFDDKIVWVFYASGQILLAMGVVASL